MSVFPLADFNLNVFTWTRVLMAHITANQFDIHNRFSGAIHTCVMPHNPQHFWPSTSTLTRTVWYMDRMHGIRQFIRIIPWNAPFPHPRKKTQSINISSPKPLNIIVGTTVCLHCFDSLFCFFFFFILIHSSSIPPSMDCNNRSFYGVQCIKLKFNHPTNALNIKRLKLFPGASIWFLS